MKLLVFWLLLHGTPLPTSILRVTDGRHSNYRGQNNREDFSRSDGKEPIFESRPVGYGLECVGAMLVVMAFFATFFLVGFGVSEQNLRLCGLGLLLGLLALSVGVLLIHKGMDIVDSNDYPGISQQIIPFFMARSR